MTAQLEDTANSSSASASSARNATIIHSKMEPAGLLQLRCVLLDRGQEAQLRPDERLSITSAETHRLQTRKPSSQLSRLAWALLRQV